MIASVLVVHTLVSKLWQSNVYDVINVLVLAPIPSFTVSSTKTSPRSFDSSGNGGKNSLRKSSGFYFPDCWNRTIRVRFSCNRLSSSTKASVCRTTKRWAMRSNWNKSRNEKTPFSFREKHSAVNCDVILSLTFLVLTEKKQFRNLETLERNIKKQKKKTLHQLDIKSALTIDNSNKNFYSFKWTT